MNLKTLKKDVNSAIYKSGEEFILKNALREIEEIEKNKYIAFVDDQKASHDVMIQISDDLEVIDHSCDCNNIVPFCAHKIALAIQAKSGSKTPLKTASKKIKAKKVDPIMGLLDEINPIRLKEWIYGLAKGNKEFLYKLKSEFEVEEVELTSKAIDEKTTLLFKVVMKQAKYFDNTQILKIIALWQPYHTSVLDKIFSQNPNPKNLKFIQDVYSSAEKYADNYKRQNDKIQKYLDTLSEYISIKLDGINPHQAEQTILEMINLFDSKGNSFEILSPTIIKNLGKISLPKNKEIIVKYIQSLIHKKDINDTRKLIEKLEQMDILIDYLHLFEAMQFQSDYNDFIIKKNLDHARYAQAEKLCLKSISKIHSEEYNLRINQHLKTIYTFMDDRMALQEVLVKTVPFDLNFDDYIFLKNNLTGIEFKNFEKILKARLSTDYYGTSRFIFDFKKLAFENDLPKMIEQFSKTVALVFFEPYIEKMVEFDRDKFLISLIKMKDFGRFNRKMTKSDEEYWLEIANKYYKKSEVQTIYKTIVYYSEADTVIKEFLKPK
jgi:hypothetical protein